MASYPETLSKKKKRRVKTSSNSSTVRRFRLGSLPLPKLTFSTAIGCSWPVAYKGEGG